MITILLEQIIQLLTGWIEKFNNHAEAVENSLDTLNATAADIETNTDPIPEIRDNTGAVITPINNIKSNTDSIVTSSSTTASNTTIIKNNIGTIATNTGSAAAFAEDCANNTLDIKDKVTTIASDTTQIRADHVELENDLDKIYNAIKWSCLDIETTETESGTSPLSFNTDKADSLVGLNVGINYTQSGSGTASPSNPRTISGFNAMNLSVNGVNNSISLGTTVYSGTLNVLTGELTLDCKAITINDLTTLSYVSAFTRFQTSMLNSEIKRPAGNNQILAGLNCECLKPTYASSSITEDFGVAVNTLGDLFITESDYTDPTTLKTNLGAYYIIYPLNTPVVVNLTPTAISSIIGDNVIAADTNGNIEVTYKESVKLYLDKQDA